MQLQFIGLKDDYALFYTLQIIPTLHVHVSDALLWRQCNSKLREVGMFNHDYCFLAEASCV